MNQHLGGRLDVMSHSGKVVGLGVPCEATDDDVKLDGGKDLRVQFLFPGSSLEDPLAELFFLLAGCRLNLVSLFSSCKDVLGVCVRFLSEQLWANEMDFEFVCYGEEALVHSRAPLNCVDNFVG